MSNDLISRSVVMDYLREQHANVIIEKNKNGFVTEDVCNGMTSALSAFMNFIVQIPVAYDIDKVVERLENQRSGLTTWAEDEAYKMGIEKAIEIVKSGGVE